MQRDEMLRYLDETLEPSRFRDYCPNGLQVEGRAGIGKVLTGVTASAALIEAAIARGADAIVVHHGYFWRGEDARITGIRRQRLARLLAAEINLIAYHLPLDAHPELGNNAQLAARCGWRGDGRFGEQELGWLGTTLKPGSLADFAAGIGTALARAPQVIGDPARPVRRIGWCSGGAQGYFEQAIALGVDAYVSGEISEPTVHLARESGVAYVAAGHHATERYGVEALGRQLAARFGLAVEFVDIDNPV